MHSSLNPSQSSRPSQSRAATSSAQGPRERNEDAWLCLPELGIYAVADGMGGLVDGHEASRTTLDLVAQRAPALAACFSQHGAAAQGAVVRELDGLFRDASALVSDLAATRGGRMGCTLTLAVLGEDRLLIAHVGDSRAYLVRGDEVRQLTEDHSVAALRVRLGRMTAEDAERSPLRNRLYQAIGVTEEPEPDVVELQLSAGDALLLCSDGLWEPLDMGRVAGLIAGCSAAAAVRAVVGAAEAVGLSDNATGVLIQTMAAGGGLDRAGLLRSAVLFSDLDPSDISRLVPWLGERRLGTGEALVQEGDTGDEIMVLAAGSLRVHKTGVGLVDLHPGAHMGEISMLLGTPRTASIAALEPSVVLVLPRTHLHELMRRRPVLASAITWRMAQFLAQRVVTLSDGGKA